MNTKIYLEVKLRRKITGWTKYGEILDICDHEYGSRFRLLTKVASISLVIPHSNTDEGRIFSSVRKDKIDFRQSMELDRTLSSLLICQLNNDGDCLSYEPSHAVVLKSKKVTNKAYNAEHSRRGKN